MKLLHLSLSLFALVAVSACGGDDDTNNNNNNNNAALDWKNLDAAAKGAYMGSTVLPEMTTIFQAFNATRYASVTCDTCHGPDGASAMYQMPNPNLPKLSATLQDEFANSSTVADFMAGMVVPRMASLLELTPVDPMTGEGEFGCFSCHTMK